MLWEEDEIKEQFTVPDDVVDVAFAIDCRCLPADHAEALSEAVCRELPWLRDEEGAGLHLIHGADSGNGWYRPEGEADVIFLSRRAKLTLRLPKRRIEDARKLSGRKLDVAGNVMEVGTSSVRLLSAITTLYSRYVVASEDEDEAAFLTRSIQQLKDMGLRFKKILSGRSHYIARSDGRIFVRSLMVADLSPADSVQLQQRGLGPNRMLGCGLFIPHKAVKNIYRD